MIEHWMWLFHGVHAGCYGAMITIVSGDPGAGKTLRVLSWMEQAVNQGRWVFTNIKLRPECPFSQYVVEIDTPGFPICADAPDPVTGFRFFWQYTRNVRNALIVIDEGDIHFDSTDSKIYGRDCRIYHKQHRKFKHDVVYIVQNVGTMYKRIRNLAGRYVHAEHTYKTVRAMGVIRMLFGVKFALGMSRFLYGEFCDEDLRRARGVGHMYFSEAKRMFEWYDTEQLLGDTDTLLSRPDHIGNGGIDDEMLLGFEPVAPVLSPGDVPDVVVPPAKIGVVIR